MFVYFVGLKSSWILLVSYAKQKQLGAVKKGRCQVK